MVASLPACNPTVRVTEWGAVHTTSRDVAAYFSRNHRDVLRSIDNLVSAEPSLCVRNFAQTSETVEMPNGGGRQSRQFMMDRDGFVLLVMGFTGAKALAFKLAYIQAFNEMEEAYYYPKAPKGADSIDFADPGIIAGVLRHLQAENGARLQVAAPPVRPQASVRAIARVSPDLGIPRSGAALCITDAAKILHLGRAELTRQLEAMRWIYKRTGGKHWLAYEDKRRAGYLEHDETRYGGRISPRARITAKGLERLKRALVSH